jgi:DNA modification methylase
VIAYDNRCLIGDCRDSMRQMIADGVRVQMCVTSPPYWGLRDYGSLGQIGLEPTVQAYIDTMVEVFRLVRELLSDDATAWLNLGDSYAQAGGPGWQGKNGLKAKDLLMMPARVALALQADGWYLRQDIIWHKPNPMPESVQDRCTKAHEYLFLLSRSEHYYFDAEAIKEKSSAGTHARLPGNAKPAGQAEYEAGDQRQRTKAGLLAFHQKMRKRKMAAAGNGVKNNDSFDAAMAVMPERANRRSVWTVASEPYSGAHFATFPPKLIEPCILAGSRVGDLVLDPFFGSGTVGQVAQRLGRKWIGCDLQEAYAPMQARRTAQQGFEL